MFTDILFYGMLVFFAIFLVLYYFVLRTNKKKNYEYIENLTGNVDKNILYDAPTEDDKIGYRDYALALANQIEANHNFMVYGIYGPWGSGKTSLMKMIRRCLKSDTTIWFDAWKYKGKVSIFDALCQEISDYLGRKQSINDIDFKKIRNSKKIAISIQHVKQFQNNLKTLVKYINANNSDNIVVFVDDLDRCDAGSAIEFLENLKVFFDIPNLCFVIGVNSDVLLQEIQKKYDNPKEKGMMFAREYLAKIINIPFYIPNIDRNSIEKYIKENINDEGIKAASAVFAIGNDGTLRSVKRIINSYKILLTVAKNKNFKINYVLLAKMLVIQHRFRDYYLKMIYNPYYLLWVQRQLSYDSRSQRKKTEDIPYELGQLLDIKPYFSEKEAEKYVLFLHKENFIENDYTHDVEMIIELLKKEEYGAIKTLAILSESDRKQVVNMLMSKYLSSSNEKKAQIIMLLGTTFTNEIEKFYYDVVLNENDYNLRLDAVEAIIRRGKDVNRYISNLSFDDLEGNNEVREYFVKLALLLVDHDKKYGVDILQRIVNVLGVKVFDSELGMDIVATLKKSKDKKALDILEVCFSSKNEKLINEAIVAIGYLDVNSLINWYNTFAYDQRFRFTYFNSIVNNASVSSNISGQIEISSLTELIGREDIVDNKLVEIKLLQLLVKHAIMDWYNDESFYFDEENTKGILNNANELLDNLSRHDDNWEVRELSDTVFGEIKKFMSQNMVSLKE